MPRCSGSPGVPASTSRNGASSRTCWLALRSVRPTSRSSVCASSSSTASGFLRQRVVSSSRRFPHSRTAAPIRRSRRPPRPPSGQQLRHRRRGRQHIEQRGRGGDVARGQGDDVHIRFVVAAGALEPVEQHGLAVAARSRQGDVVRRGGVAEQVRQALGQHGLLVLAPGECRRSGARPGGEDALHRRHHADKTYTGAPPPAIEGRRTLSAARTAR